MQTKHRSNANVPGKHMLGARFGSVAFRNLPGQTGVIGRPKTGCTPGYKPYYDG
jgi:hypothetical protein